MSSPLRSSFQRSVVPGTRGISRIQAPTSKLSGDFARGFSNQRTSRTQLYQASHLKPWNRQLLHSQHPRHNLVNSASHPRNQPHTSRSTMYNNKIFTSTSNSGSGEVDSQTRFHYHQDNQVVWAEYQGGSIVKGFLIATVNPDSSLDMRYQHVNGAGELMTGRCRSVPEILHDGRLRMHEKWTWTSGDCSSGESVIEEVKG